MAKKKETKPGFLLFFTPSATVLVPLVWVLWDYSSVLSFFSIKVSIQYKKKSYICKKYIYTNLHIFYMKRLLTVLLAGLLVCSFCEVQAQTKTSKSKTTQSSSKSKKNKKKGKNKEPEPAPVSNDIPLPYNSNDCLFAIELKPDVEFGPTVAPVGGGRIMEVMADKKHPNLFEYEHNSVWYKFTVPYNGELEIAITQTNPLDDYDFLLYRYTDDYFSNHVLQNKVLPVAFNLSAVDSALAKPPATAKTKSKAKTAAAPVAVGPSLGMKHDAKDLMLTKKSKEKYIRSISVRKDEVYYLVLDNNSKNGSGHSVKVSVHVDAFEPLVCFYDPSIKKYIDVDLLILEKNTGNREILKSSAFKNGRIKFVPNFNYTLYAKRDGYFSIYKDFNSNIFMADTMMRFVMNRTEKGTSFPISDIYFDEGESVLLPVSDTVLLNYIAMFRNHPDVTFLIKGYVNTYGVDVAHDQKVSLERAQSVKDFFARNGIDGSRIEVAGMTPTEIKRAASANFDKKQKPNTTKVELIITGIRK